MICTKPCGPQAQLRQPGAGLLLGEGCACSSPYPTLPLPALGTVLAGTQGLKPGSSWQKIYKNTLRLHRGAHKTVGAQMTATSPLSLMFLSYFLHDFFLTSKAKMVLDEIWFCAIFFLLILFEKFLQS